MPFRIHFRELSDAYDLFNDDGVKKDLRNHEVMRRTHTPCTSRMNERNRKCKKELVAMIYNAALKNNGHVKEKNAERNRYSKSRRKVKGDGRGGRKQFKCKRVIK